MPANRITFPTAFSLWGEEEYAAIDRVLTSGKLTMGPEVASLEQEFAAYHGKRHGIMVNSGSSANLVAVAALTQAGLMRGQTVAVPALAWSTTYAPLVQYGLRLVLLDCDDTWNAAPDTLDNHDVAAVVACSILGNPAHLDHWRRLTRQRDLFLLEDNCESCGALTGAGELCGTFGTLSTFSFFYSHQISAIEGGMILTDDAVLARSCRILRAHGWTRDVEPPQSFEDEYDFVRFGYNVRPLEMHAAVAAEQLRKLETMTSAREANAMKFRELTQDLPIEHPVINGSRISPFGLAFTFVDSGIRGEAVVALRGSGIDCRLPTGGSFRLHKYGRPWFDQKTSYADYIHTHGLFIGCPPFEASEPITRAADVLRQVCR